MPNAERCGRRIGGGVSPHTSMVRIVPSPTAQPLVLEFQGLTRPCSSPRTSGNRAQRRCTARLRDCRRVLLRCENSYFCPLR
jgi:hypothetical protein